MNRILEMGMTAIVIIALSALVVCVAQNLKPPARTLICLSLVGVISVFGVYCTNGGRITERKIDTSMLCDENPVRREKNIESCTTATVKVSNLDYYDWAGVVAEFEDIPDVRVLVYLSKNDAAKLNVGDSITVKGRVNYISPDSTGVHNLVIGNAIAIFPYSLEAKLVNISPAVTV